MDAGGLPFQLKLSGDKSQILQESDSHGDSKSGQVGDEVNNHRGHLCAGSFSPLPKWQREQTHTVKRWGRRETRPGRRRWPCPT